MKTMNGGGRQIKTHRPQLTVINRKPKGICISSVRDSMYYRWLHRDTPERELAKAYGVKREDVEAIVREETQERLKEAA